MQADINHYVTRDRINNARFRQKLDPIAKKYIKKTKSFRTCFSRYSTVDTQSPIAGSLLRELDLGKKEIAS